MKRGFKTVSLIVTMLAVSSVALTAAAQQPAAVQGPPSPAKAPPSSAAKLLSTGKRVKKVKIARSSPSLGASQSAVHGSSINFNGLIDKSGEHEKKLADRMAKKTDAPQKARKAVTTVKRDASSVSSPGSAASDMSVSLVPATPVEE